MNNPRPDVYADREILTVSALNRRARGLVEREFGMVWVSGEISNFSRPSSGHMYFSLKDAQAQVQCALFKQNARQLNFAPAQGMQVTVRARVSLYEPQGRFQLIAEHMALAGDGALQRAFDALKRKLEAEGLFDPARKKALPALPERIGVITSPTGRCATGCIDRLASPLSGHQCANLPCGGTRPKITGRNCACVALGQSATGL